MQRMIIITILLFGFSVGVTLTSNAQIKVQSGPQVNNSMVQQNQQQAIAGKPQFILKGNIEMSGLHKLVKYVRVDCLFYSDKHREWREDSKKVPVGQYGTVTSDYTVNVNVPSTINPSDITRYDCSVTILDKDESSQLLFFAPKKGTTPILAYEGTFYPKITKKTKHWGS